MHEPRPAVEATVDLDLRVPRGTPGSLVDGIAAVLERIDDVRDATVLGVSDMTPSPADLYVTTTVRVAVRAADDAAAVRGTLADGFGVTDVRSVALAEAEGTIR